MTVTTPIILPSDQDATGRTLGDEEIAAVTAALRSGTLTSTKGVHTKTFEKRFASLIGVKHAFACSSGSAAMHCAVSAIDPEPGDEIVTTSITDMGALTPILYQGAIPVFADVDPRTCNVTAKTIERVLSPRTRAIVVTHLFGNAAEMDEILALARSRNIRVIEDCAQAFLASYRGKHVGTFGDVNAFSLQQGKHITTGEGGIVTTNDDELAHRIYLFINKGWGYGDPKPDHDFIALNYRMNELTGAVANAQLDKLAPVVERRIERAKRLTASLRGLAGISTPHIPDGSTHVYWKYTIRVDKDVIPGGPVAIAALLKEHNIFAVPRYIQKPAFRCAIFAERRTFGKSQWPFTLARPEALAYDDAHFPGTLAGLEQVLVLPWNEHFTNEHVDFISTSLRGAAERLAVGAK